MKKNIVIIILAILVLGLGGYLVYDKVLSSDSVASGNNFKCNNGEETPSAKDYDLTKAEELLEYFGFNDSIGRDKDKIYSSMYTESYKKLQAIKKVSNDKIKTVDCSKLYSEVNERGNYKTNYSQNYFGYGVCLKDSKTDVISYEIVNEIYKKMYGTDMSKLGFDTMNISSHFYNFYDYNKELDSFVKLECDICGGGFDEAYLVNEIKSAKEIGNELIIEVYYLYGTPLIAGNLPEPIFRLSTSKIYKELNVKDIESFEKEVKNNYLDKLDVYEVIFEKQEDNYIFKSLSKKLS